MIDIETIQTSSLGDRSYLAHDGQVAVVVDQQRDIDRVLDLVGQRGLQVTHVVETHVHNDYVTGGLELAQGAGAAYVLAEGSGVAFHHRAVTDGQVLEAGSMRLRVLHTPGHTHSHVSYVLETADGHPSRPGVSRHPRRAVASGIRSCTPGAPGSCGPCGPTELRRSVRS